MQQFDHDVWTNRNKRTSNTTSTIASAADTSSAVTSSAIASATITATLEYTSSRTNTTVVGCYHGYKDHKDTISSGEPHLNFVVTVVVIASVVFNF
jgi:hypothetical protein